MDPRSSSDGDAPREPRPDADAATTEPQPAVRIVAIRGDGTVEESTDPAAIAGLHEDPATRLWIDFSGAPGDVIHAAALTLGLHRLVAEDIVERNSRAKVEAFDELVHVVLFGLRYAGETTATEIDFVLGPRFLVSVHDPSWEPRSAAPLRLGPAHVLGKGPDFLFYALADAIVDGYFPVLDRLGDEIEDLQDRVLADASDWTLQRLFVLKRELVEIRRATSPAREIFNQLTNREVGAIAEAHVVYFRDVYDHLIRVTDELDNYRELVGGTLDIYVSIVNNDLSRIMKRLTGVTVILAGVGAVAGIFGMSEAGAAFAGGEAAGFWIVTGAVVLLATIAAIVLRRIDWI